MSRLYFFARILIIFGITEALIVLGLYTRFGYIFPFVFLWCGALVCVTLGFFLINPRPRIRISTNYLKYAVLLILLFAPLYLVRLFDIPWQINTDEVTIMQWMQRLTLNQDVNLFGLSEYFYHPNFIFIAFGSLAKLLGGINLQTVRFVHSLAALLTILSVFTLSASMLSVRRAVAVAVLFGFNHAFWAISRMAMRDNSSVLVETAALTCLVWAYKKQSKWLAFVGGALTGLSLYVYFPGRFTILIWIFTLGAWFILNKDAIRRSQYLMLSFISLIGWVMVAGPMLITLAKAPQTGFYYQRQQTLLFPEGRKLQQAWVSAPSEWDGVLYNIKNGLTTFNSQMHDHQYIYPNFGHGLLDPLSGFFLWVGLLTLLSKKRKYLSEIVVLCGFLVIWLLSTFVINKSPAYPRLLIILPFTYFLVFTGIQTSVSLINRVHTLPRSASVGITGFIIIVIAIFHSSMFADFIQKGFKEGNDVGSTARYVVARSDKMPYLFYLAADQNYPYYNWGEASQWNDWLGFFKKPGQLVTIIPPKQLLAETKQPPFTLFMNETVWHEKKKELEEFYPLLRRQAILPNGRLVAIEVLK